MRVYPAGRADPLDRVAFPRRRVGLPDREPRRIL